MRPLFLVVGVALIFVGLVVVSASSVGGSASTGGFVLIGPIPIAFGSGTNGSLLSVLAVVLGIVMLALLFFAFFMTRRADMNRREEINK